MNEIKKFAQYCLNTAHGAMLNEVDGPRPRLGTELSNDGLSHSYTRVDYRRTVFRFGLPEPFVVHRFRCVYSTDRLNGIVSDCLI